MDRPITTHHHIWHGGLFAIFRRDRTFITTDAWDDGCLGNSNAHFLLFILCQPFIGWDRTASIPPSRRVRIWITTDAWRGGHLFFFRNDEAGGVRLAVGVGEGSILNLGYLFLREHSGFSTHLFRSVRRWITTDAWRGGHPFFFRKDTVGAGTDKFTLGFESAQFLFHLRESVEGIAGEGFLL